ncbi:MAG: restriction endonuclease [Deltaproteobacteria bacterium]|nr:restriction endonuclease [Deltaproteobacteria bacterium]
MEWLFTESFGTRDDAGESQGQAFDNETNRDGEDDLDGIDLMEPIEFEAWVLGRFKRKDYEVKTTPLSGDAGSDGIAISPDNSRFPSYMIQCKHTQQDKNIGHSAVEEILNSLDRYDNLPDGIQPLVVTNANGFTTKARTLARNQGVRLISKNQLHQL